MNKKEKIKKKLENLQSDINSAYSNMDKDQWGTKPRLKEIHRRLMELQKEIVIEYPEIDNLELLTDFDKMNYSRGDIGMYQLLKNTLDNLTIEIDNSDDEQTFSIKTPSLDDLENLLMRFHDVEIELKTRRAPKNPLLIENEYDVQYILRSMLKIYFQNVMAEDPQTTHVGRANTIDFVIPELKVGIECKKTRDNLRDAQLGDELLADIPRYQKRGDVETLYIFVHDSDHFLKNPKKIENDLISDFENKLKLKFIFIR